MNHVRRGASLLWHRVAKVPSSACPSSRGTLPGADVCSLPSICTRFLSTSGSLTLSSTGEPSIARTKGEYEDQQVKVVNFNFEERGSTVLGGDIFDVPMRPDIVQRVVRWQLAKRQQGTHSTKTRAEVNRTGRKPWSQKGTGRARHGDLKAPQFRGGATMHGPRPRSHEIGLPKQIRRLGLKVALSARMAEGKLLVMESLEPPDNKTKFLASFVKSLNGKKALLVDGEWASNDKLRQAAANLFYANTLPAGGLNVYSILQHDTLVMSLEAVQKLEERLRTPVNR